jgi:hypothetical protein
MIMHGDTSKTLSIFLVSPYPLLDTEGDWESVRVADRGADGTASFSVGGLRRPPLAPQPGEPVDRFPPRQGRGAPLPMGVIRATFIALCPA